MVSKSLSVFADLLNVLLQTHSQSLFLFRLTSHKLRWWAGIYCGSAEMAIIGTVLWALHPALWSQYDLCRMGGAQWLISWPGRTTTPPLARAYGAACPMDSCVGNTHPLCVVCLCVCVWTLLFSFGHLSGMSSFSYAAPCPVVLLLHCCLY